MAWPYDDPGQMPDFLMQQGAMPSPAFAPPPGPGPDAGQSDADLLAAITGSNAPQEAMPHDFWSRFSQGGPVNYNAGRNPTGLEVLLSALSGFANAKAGQGARRVDETQQRNAQARDAAKTLANWRHQERMVRDQRQATMDAAKAARAARLATPEPLEDVIDPKTGKAVKLPRSQASGREPAYAPVRPPSAYQIDTGNRADRSLDDQILSRIYDDYNTNKQVMGYTNVRSNLATAKVARDQKNGTGDVALIFSYMRALEPDNPNVVREGDFKVARLAAGQLQRAASIPQRFFSGDLLTDAGRQYFVDQMERSLKAREPDYKAVQAMFRKRAKKSGVEPTDFMLDLQGPAGGGATTGGPDDKVKIVRDGVRGTVSRKYLRPTDQVVQ